MNIAVGGISIRTMCVDNAFTAAFGCSTDPQEDRSLVRTSITRLLVYSRLSQAKLGTGVLLASLARHRLAPGQSASIGISPSLLNKLSMNGDVRGRFGASEKLAYRSTMFVRREARLVFRPQVAR